MISKISLFISSCALTFQVIVLNPWHNTISKQIQSLEQEIKNKKISSS
jgi:hypothetical protein